MAPRIAEIQPLISKPDNNPAANLKIIALITNVKKPSVKKFMGIDRNKRAGRIKMLRRPTTKLAIIAVPKLLILKPGTTYATITKTALDKSHWPNNCNIPYLFVNAYLIH